MTRRPTINDVALRAGVAIGTVSRFLNDRPVRRDSASRIEEAIAELGFVRNLAAATMRNESSALIGFLVSSYDDFQKALLSQLTGRLQAAGRLVLPLTHDGSESAMKRALLFFAEHRVSAIVASGDFPAMTTMRNLIGPEAHVVLFNNDLPGMQADRVLLDDAGAARLAVAHLLDLGHRRIGLIAGRQGHSSGLGRLAGYQQALKEGGVEADPALVAGHDWSEQAGYLGLQQLLDLPDPPTAVLCTSYLSAMGAAELARERGISIPEQLSLVSFGDTRAFQLIGPGLDAISVPVDRMAESIEAFCLRNGDSPGGRSVRLPCDFVRRGSTTIPKPLQR